MQNRVRLGILALPSSGVLGIVSVLPPGVFINPAPDPLGFAQASGRVGCALLSYWFDPFRDCDMAKSTTAKIARRSVFPGNSPFFSLRPVLQLHPRISWWGATSDQWRMDRC